MEYENSFEEESVSEETGKGEGVGDKVGGGDGRAKGPAGEGEDPSLQNVPSIA